jgi:hypothetical protein
MPVILPSYEVKQYHAGDVVPEKWAHSDQITVLVFGTLAIKQPTEMDYVLF